MSSQGPFAAVKALFASVDPACFSPEDRALLAARLEAHPDPWAREQGAAWLAAWGEQARLVRLCEDPAFLVRKAAMYHLGRTRPDDDTARFVWQHLSRPDAMGTHGYETLTAYADLAPRDEAHAQLAALAANEGRPESLRTTALWRLVEWGERATVARLVGALSEPPQTTWAWHIALLGAADHFGLTPPDLAHLREVDHIDLRLALAPFARSR
jgi:hypothetical protein